MCTATCAQDTASKKTETEWVEHIAKDYGVSKANIEVGLATGVRCDMLTDDGRFAVEVDWAMKWAEGIGQSLYYAECTNREPALLLLLKKSADRKYIDRAMVVCAKYNITVWVFNTSTAKKERLGGHGANE